MDMGMMFENDQIVESVVNDEDKIDLSVYLVENYNRINTTQKQGGKSNSDRYNSTNPINSTVNFTNSVTKNRRRNDNSQENNASGSKSRNGRPILRKTPHQNQHPVDIYGTSAPEQQHRMMEYSPSSLTFSSMGTSLLEYVSTSYDWIKSSIEF